MDLKIREVLTSNTERRELSLFGVAVATKSFVPLSYAYSVTHVMTVCWSLSAAPKHQAASR